MTHLAAIFFFALVMAGAGAILQLTVRDYWRDILAALHGEIPARSAVRSWAPRSRPTARPRPVLVRAMPQPQRAAS